MRAARLPTKRSSHRPLTSACAGAGKSCPKSYTVEEIAAANIATHRRCFPTAMKSANYLSGGQSLADAAARLSAINKAKTKQVRGLPNPNP